MQCPNLSGPLLAKQNQNWVVAVVVQVVILSIIGMWPVPKAQLSGPHTQDSVFCDWCLRIFNDFIFEECFVRRWILGDTGAYARAWRLHSYVILHPVDSISSGSNVWGQIPRVPKNQLASTFLLLPFTPGRELGVGVFSRRGKERYVPHTMSQSRLMAPYCIQ